jgi:hemin uptake protein HemP
MSVEGVPILTAAASDLPLYQAEDLTRGGVQALIRLGDRTYTLRITRAGKLILTR